MSVPSRFRISFFLFLCLINSALAQPFSPEIYNVKWTSQSKNSGESMPCGGGDVGLNVWVENGDVLFYLSKSGAFDENNVFPKLGRVRIRLSPNPFRNGTAFRQELKLQEGYVEIAGDGDNQEVVVKVWVDVFNPVVHVDVAASKPVQVSAWYESWRTQDREMQGKEKNASSFKWLKDKVIASKDSIKTHESGILFYHQNKDSTLFDLIVKQQQLEPVKSQLWNPLKGMVYGGWMQGENMAPELANGQLKSVSGKYVNTAFQGFGLKSNSPSKQHHLNIFLHTEENSNAGKWENGLFKIVSKAKSEEKTARQKTLDWWNAYWQRSHIAIRVNKPDTASPVWQTGRNYQLFRYMLGCNAFGAYPTKFNGGLFTHDPVFIDSTLKFGPDYRSWGGGTFTAQNQRLVYWPMLKSGDFEMMASQFDFYLRTLSNAETRTKHYWGHRGASFTEQIENFGLPNYAEYGQKRPKDFDPGVEYNAWLEYLWDTSLEFCLMMLDIERFTGTDISRYLPLIESCTLFFDEHYQHLAERRGAKKLDQNGHLVVFPGSAAETYKMAYNSVTTIAGLKTVLSRMLALPAKYGTETQREEWKARLGRVPPLSFRQMQGHQTIAPAKAWERIQNTEIPQLYPVFPFGMYGVGLPDLDVAVNTWKYDTEAIKNRNHTSWHQDNIFCARLGLTDEAAALTVKKLQNSGRRFPAFWGPGHDWVPDHNWGGSGMIGLQEMLMQAVGDSIYLFPAWPRDWDVKFKLHAPYNTTVEGELQHGKIVHVKVTPESRRKDLVIAELSK
ncbi:DUF5703 domain-containing protein [Dyadobacter psychrophilus]|uniref:DUF5703 domain-containing protein n=1 Tax=Dyadobacter psychrophilus TaxID=651661 RepID=A0A1T5G8G2_9BACT|nr:DUF5703 domain-containing protein [Dyadobacter psychrophilus]SKC04783.1 hypothetical protein SAMN05660293_03787 [Dyadobacter psychrophilus]